MEWGWRETLAQQGTGRAKTITVTKPDGSPDSFTPPTKDKIIASSYGAASLGYEVTSSKAFAQCQVEKVYKFVCLQDPRSADSTEIETIRDAMPGDNYNMKHVFAKVATMCMGN